MMPKILKQICKTSKVPVIAGGLISDKEDVMGALGAGQQRFPLQIRRYGNCKAAEALICSKEMYWRIFIWQNILWRWIPERPVIAVFFLMKKEGSAVWHRRSLSSIFRNRDG